MVELMSTTRRDVAAPLQVAVKHMANAVKTTETLGDSYSKSVPLPRISNNRELGRDSVLPHVAVAVMGVSDVVI